MTRLYHFSDVEGIEIFHPRPPLRHPDSEPLVYTIDGWHSPLYFFPRDCPRIGIWPVAATTDADLNDFKRRTSQPMRLFIDREFVERWRNENLIRYSFDPSGFVDCEDHGVWVSRQPVKPVHAEIWGDLPLRACEAGIDVEVVSSLTDLANELFDYSHEVFRTSLHVSMVRLSQLPGWNARTGGPTLPRSK